MRLAVAAIWGATLAFFALAFALQDRASWPEDAARVIGGDVALFAASQALGGAVAGFLLAGLFGRGGPFGWLLSILGAVLALLLGALAGGAVFGLRELVAGGQDLVLGLIRVGMGPLGIIFASAQAPLLAVALVLATALAHLAARRLRTPRA